jgi:putative sugar O-methyltransferase
MDAEASDRTLRAMFDDLRAADRLYWPSPFWQQLNETQMKQLEEHGLAHLKRTVNMRYFNWDLKGILAHQLLPVVKHWVIHPDLGPFKQARLGDASLQAADAPRVAGLAWPLSMRAYALYLMLLRHYVAADDARGLLEQLDEPELGDPIAVAWRGRKVSQDLCNSVHEFYAATRGVDVDQEGFSVTELGAGYGRLGFVFLKALPSCRYTVIDIPPALYVAQWYLSSVFPETRVFRFRPFTAFEDVREEFEAARIRFIGAHQIRMLPDKSSDLFLNISSLHEMTLEQIRLYLGEVDRLTRGHFYLKQWRTSRALANGFRIRESEYPLPPRWSPIYRERHPLQRMFFHALFSVPA